MSGKPGRPRGKRSNPNYIFLGGYITRDTYKEVKHLLIDSDMEISELLQTLLDQWIDEQYAEEDS